MILIKVSKTKKKQHHHHHHHHSHHPFFAHQVVLEPGEVTRAESESSEAHDVGPVAPEGWWFVGDQRLGPVRKRQKTKRGGEKNTGKNNGCGGKTRGKHIENG